MATMDTVKNTIMAKKSAPVQEAPMAQLTAITQDDNASKTPQANAEDIDILAFNLMAAVDLLKQLAERFDMLESKMGGEVETEVEETAPVPPVPVA